MIRDVKDYIKMFRDAKSFDTSRFDEYTELAAFYEMEQSNLTSYQYEKPWVIDVNVPYASDAIDMRVASLQANDYAGEIEPLAPEDTEYIKNLNNAYHNFWNEMQMDDVVNNALETAAVVREFYTHIIYDDDIQVGGSSNKRIGKLFAYPLNPTAILIDPKALSLKTARYIMVMERIDEDTIKDEYSEKFAKDTQIKDSFTYDDRGEIYEGNDSINNQDKVYSKLTVYEKIKGGVITKVVIVGDEIVESKDPFQLDIFPISQFRWQKKIKSPYGRSLMDRLLPSQKSVNSIESAITNTALQFASPSFGINKNSGVSGKKLASVIGAPGLILEFNGDPNTQIAPLFKGDVINQTMVEMKRANEETIYKMAGATPQFQGELGSAGNTSGGTKDVIARSKTIENKVIANLEEYIQDTSEIIIKYILEGFGGKTITTRGAKKSDGTFDFNSFDVPEQKEGADYSFYINLDVKTPYSKEKQKQQLLELFQIEQQYDSPVKTVTMADIFETFDLPNKQELVQRQEMLAKNDANQKSQLITQFVAQAEQYGIDVNMITQAIAEIIQSTGKEPMPTVEQITLQMEQIAQQRQTVQMQSEQQLMNQQMQAQGTFEQNQIKDANKPLTGNETF